MGSATGTQEPKKAASAAARSGATLRVMIVLAALLLLVGVAGAGALKLLVHAMRPPTSADTAALVCTAFMQQDYSLLTQHIDTSPVPHATGTQLDIATLPAQLASLDTAYGKVTDCVYNQMPASTADALAQYAFTLHRAKAKAPTSLVVFIVREPDGSWKVRGDSQLTNPPNAPN